MVQRLRCVGPTATLSLLTLILGSLAAVGLWLQPQSRSSSDTAGRGNRRIDEQSWRGGHFRGRRSREGANLKFNLCAWLGPVLALPLLAVACGEGGRPAPPPPPSAELEEVLAVANFSTAGPEAEPGVGARLKVIDSVTGQSTDLGDINSSCFSWSPDGHRLAYGGKEGLFVAAFPGGAVQEVAGLPPASKFNCPGAWSPDGNRFLFAAIPAGEEEPSLWLASPQGEAPRELVAATATEAIGNGYWLTDGRRLLATTLGEGDVGRILIVNGETGAIEQTYAPGGMLLGVAVRNDDVIAAGVGLPTGSPGLTPSAKEEEDEVRHVVVTVDPKAGQMTQLIDGATMPEWSPDGRYLLALRPGSVGRGPIELVMMQADGTGEQSLLTEGAIGGMGAWTPDGAFLVVASWGATGKTTTVSTYNWSRPGGLGERVSTVEVSGFPAAFGGVAPAALQDLLSPSGGHMAVMRETGVAPTGGWQPTELLIVDLRNGDVRETGEEGVLAGVAWSPR